MNSNDREPHHPQGIDEASYAALQVALFQTVISTYRGGKQRLTMASQNNTSTAFFVEIEMPRLYGGPVLSCTMRQCHSFSTLAPAELSSTYL